MKKLLCAILALCFLCGCKSAPQETKNEKFIGVWITYGEIKAMAQSPAGFQNEAETAVKRCKAIGINNIFFHVRAFCDAVYESRYFPKCEYLKDTDALSVMVKLCHRNGIKLHAWINPYRVSTTSNDCKLLPENSPARRFYESSNKSDHINVCMTENSIYLNPAGAGARRLILAGVREIIENYDVDGIHFDDYFYPTTAADFDKASYEEYAKTAEFPLSLENWRRQNVNTLLYVCYCAIKQKNGNILFGISPAADIDRCYNSLFADVEGWLNGGYVDYILPQLYFGFEYPNERFRFDNLLIKWLDTVSGKAELYCGLANYKIGTDSKADKAEWNTKTDIIARQIDLMSDYGISGFAFFSYSSLFSGAELNRRQLNNIKREVKKKGFTNE